MLKPLYPSEWQKPEPTLFTLIGLPGTGKSVWAKEQVKYHSVHYAIISTDYFLELIAKENGKNYKWAYTNHFKEANQKAMEQVKMAVKNKKHIIWDQTNLSVKSRRRSLSMITDDYYKIAVLFETSHVELMNRIERRERETGKGIPPSVIFQMHENFAMPSVEEGFDVVHVNTGQEYEETMKTMIGWKRK